MEKKQKKESPKGEEKQKKPLNEFGDHMEKFAVKTAESIRKVIDKALASRNTVLTIRVNDECNERLNMLVEAGLFKSRSESAAYLIEEGIKRQKSLFSKVENKCREIDKLREDIQGLINEELKK